MKDGTKIYVIRYSEKPYKNCMYEHKQVEKEVGYCWFAKWGKKVSENTLKEILTDKALILLYYKNKSFLADLIEYSFTPPMSGYPDYYDEVVFQDYERIAVYLKLKKIREVDSDIIEKLITNSTGRVVDEIFHHSSCSNVYSTYYEDITSELQDGDACIYIRKKRCSNKKCVNYDYFCEKPMQCTKYMPRF